MTHYYFSATTTNSTLKHRHKYTYIHSCNLSSYLSPFVFPFHLSFPSVINSFVPLSSSHRSVFLSLFFRTFSNLFDLLILLSTFISYETTCTQSRQHHHLRRRVRRARETRREPGPSRPIVPLTHFRLVSRLAVSHLLFIYRPSLHPSQFYIPLFQRVWPRRPGFRPYKFLQTVSTVCS